MPAPKAGRQCRGDLREQQMAETVADEWYYIRMASLRQGALDRDPGPALAIPAPVLGVIATPA
jgi:hypothetical protein